MWIGYYWSSETNRKCVFSTAWTNDHWNRGYNWNSSCERKWTTFVQQWQFCRSRLRLKMLHWQTHWKWWNRLLRWFHGAEWECFEAIPLAKHWSIVGMFFALVRSVILPIRHKTLSNTSINQSINQLINIEEHVPTEKGGRMFMVFWRRSWLHNLLQHNNLGRLRKKYISKEEYFHCFSKER